ncbi:hypothetical protein WDU94_006409, partial [Cyamophila willieti]
SVTVKEKAQSVTVKEKALSVTVKEKVQSVPVKEKAQSVTAKEKAQRTKFDVRFELYKCLPIQSEEAFHRFDNLLRTDKDFDETFIEVVRGLHSVPRPNNTCDMFVQAKLKSIMSDQISVRCTVFNDRGERYTFIRFQDTRVYLALLSVIKQVYPNVHVFTVKKLISEYFKQARTRRHNRDQLVDNATVESKTKETAETEALEDDDCQITGESQLDTSPKTILYSSSDADYILPD